MNVTFLSRYFFSLHLNELIALMRFGTSVESIFIFHNDAIAFFLCTLSFPKKSSKKTFVFLTVGSMIFIVSTGVKLSKKVFTKLEGCDSVSVCVDIWKYNPVLKNVFVITARLLFVSEKTCSTTV